MGRNRTSRPPTAASSASTTPPQAIFTLSTSVIWGVNTLFLLDSGLGIFGVMVVNATFSAGQILFEVPTGVIADTIGRRASFLIGIGALVIATLGYVGAAVSSAGGWPVSSSRHVLLGFGFTCQTGAVDAWLVDALDSLGFEGPKDSIFARSGMFNGVAMVVGTLGGGGLGQLDLAVPYYVRAGLTGWPPSPSPCVFMHDVGFAAAAAQVVAVRRRRADTSSHRYQSRMASPGGAAFTLRVADERTLDVVSLLRLAAIRSRAAGPRRPDLGGGRDDGVVRPLRRGRQRPGQAHLASRLGTRPATILSVATAGRAMLATGIGVAGLVVASGAAPGSVRGGDRLLVRLRGARAGIAQPIRQAYLNEHIPSAQRATVLSFDSFFADVGGVGGQLGLGALAQNTSKALAYTVGGVIYSIAVPLYRIAGRASGKRVDLSKCLDDAGDSSACGPPPSSRRQRAKFWRGGVYII